MVEQFNLINSEKVPKCLFHGRINELKSTSIVEILGEKIKISINQIFQDNYLPKQMIFIISHDYEGEVIIKKGIYDIIYFKFGVNLLTLTKERKINPIFTEFQKIVDIFVNKRYLDVIIFINELLENDDINLSNMDIFRLFCLQSHSFLKAGLTNKAKYSLTQARSQLINIDGSFLKLDGKDNFSFNNPYSNYIFFDYGYLSGDLAYLLFLEIIYGIQTNVRSSELIEKINEGMAYTEEKNYTFFQEFSFLKLLVQNNGISKSELEEFQKFFSENTNIFFKLLIQGSLKKEEIFLNNGLNSDIKEDLKSMINEFNTSGIISKRLYSEKTTKRIISFNVITNFVESIINDTMGRTIEDQVYSVLISQNLKELNEYDLSIVKKILFLGNIARDHYYMGELDTSLTIFRNLERFIKQESFHIQENLMREKLIFDCEFIYANEEIERYSRRIIDLGLVYLFIGKIYFNQNYLDESLYYLNLSQIENLNNKKRDYATAYFFKGDIEFNKGNYNYAKDFFLISLNYLKTFGTINDIISNNIALANVLLRNKEFYQAELYYQLALKEAKVLNLKEFILLSQVKLAEIMMNQENYHKSIQFLNRSIEYSSGLNNNLFSAIILFKLYFIYHKIGLPQDIYKFNHMLKQLNQTKNNTINAIYLICFIHNEITQERKTSIEMITKLSNLLIKRDVPDEIKYFGYIVCIISFDNISDILDLQRNFKDTLVGIENKWIKLDLMKLNEIIKNNMEKDVIKDLLHNKLSHNILIINEL